MFWLLACRGVEPTEVVVRAAWPGAEAGDVERELVEPIEAAVAGIGGVSRLISVAEPGRATVRVTLVGEASVVRDAIGSLRTLPEDAEAPVVSVVVVPVGVVVSAWVGEPGPFRALAAGYPGSVLELDGQRASWRVDAPAGELRARLAELPGVDAIVRVPGEPCTSVDVVAVELGVLEAEVARVRLAASGGATGTWVDWAPAVPEVVVQVDRERAATFGVAMDDIAAVVAAAKTSGAPMEDWRDLPVGAGRLGDVASLELKMSRPIPRVDGQRGVAVVVCGLR